jgi:hypothetical protein
LAALLVASGFVACSSDEGKDGSDQPRMSGGSPGNAGAKASAGTASSAGAAGTNNGGTAGTNNGGTAGTNNGGTGSGNTNAGGTTSRGGSGGASRGGTASMSRGGSADSAGASGDGNEPGGTSGNGGNSGGNSGNGGGTSGNAGASGVDAFGIRKLYPSATSGAQWSSEHWNKGTAYSITGRTDNHDPLEISGMRGDGTLRVTGTGELVMGGSQPRIYVYPPSSGPWRDVEVTVYYKRVEDEATAYAGLVVGVRSGEGHNDDTACDAHTYYARLRHDGAIDFEKELKHPASSTRQRVAPAMVWPPDGELPFDRWIGWKFVIYNASSTSVKLESYRDLTEGANGGDWKLMSETTDSGGWSVEDDCPNHDPENGQSDMVVVDGGFTFIRNTDVTEARYRWFTIREIAP